jgi:cation transport ATPase
MKLLRTAIIAVFALSVAVTAVMIFAHIVELHTAHVVLASLTFFLLAIYLWQSAKIASLATLRELRSRFAVAGTVGETVTSPPNSKICCNGVIVKGSSQVDESPLNGKRKLADKTAGDTVRCGTINYGGELRVCVTDPLRLVSDTVITGSPMFNVCAGALAKSGIYVRSSNVLIALAKAKTLAPLGNSPEREGYEVTHNALMKLGVELTETNDSGLRIVLCNYDDFKGSADVEITHNKITHLLKAVYTAQMYYRYIVGIRWSAAAAIAAIALLAGTGQIMFAAMTLAVWQAVYVLAIRQLDRKTSKLSIEKIIKGR